MQFSNLSKNTSPLTLEGKTMYEAIKKYNNKILSKTDEENLESLLKDLPKDIDVKIWQWYKHTRIALIKDGYLV